MTEEQLEKILEGYCENRSFEEFLEEFNLTTLEVVICLYENGMIPDFELEGMIPSDV